MEIDQQDLPGQGIAGAGDGPGAWIGVHRTGQGDQWWPNGLNWVTESVDLWTLITYAYRALHLASHNAAMYLVFASKVKEQEGAVIVSPARLAKLSR
ncbi:hypothetical protein M407DRAFT_143499 [Tulasnella calospora MUT 4182]|uniref:Uncharacterized protein n=1 Tax=Tulasnella calospora MUT 4182 TaxID=1051891 RepID=A0A0C3Q846_9AGAM|nr:hypothetical protein M407DRAFT_143499 [Tulasnella calospora MUT 4182]